MVLGGLKDHRARKIFRDAGERELEASRSDIFSPL
jgi:hypothetical protein